MLCATPAAACCCIAWRFRTAAHSPAPSIRRDGGVVRRDIEWADLRVLDDWTFGGVSFFCRLYSLSWWLCVHYTVLISISTVFYLLITPVGSGWCPLPWFGTFAAAATLRCRTRRRGAWAVCRYSSGNMGLFYTGVPLPAALPRLCRYT
jgi:hypothetical protein